MGIFDFFKKNNRTRRWNYDNGVRKEEYQVNKNGVKHGIYKLYHPNQQLIVELNFTKGVQDDGKIISYHDNGKIAREVMLLNGKFNGEFLECYNNGKRKKQGFYVDNKQTILKEWSENGELKEEAPKENKAENLKLIEKEMSLEKVLYADTIEKNNITYFKGKKYNGIVQYQGASEAEFKDGIKIKGMDYFSDGTLKSISELVDGKMVEINGWIKIDKNGDYSEGGKKILVRCFKDGRKIEYYNNGNIKSEADLKRRKSNSDTNNTFVDIRYFENGNVDIKEVFNKYDSDGNNGGECVEYNLFYETGELKKEKVEDKKYTTKYISYYKNKSVKSICVSNTHYQHDGYNFEFDENGNEVSKIDLNSDGEQKARKHLKLKTASNKEISKAKDEANKRGEKVIELMIDDIKIKTTIEKFEIAEKNNDGALSDYDDDYNIELSDSFEEVCMFLNEITDEKLIIRAEHWAEDDKLGEIGIEEVSYLNCECPDNLKKYYNGELFITNRGEMLETNSDEYQSIDFDEIWENSEISNSGVICEKF